MSATIEYPGRPLTDQTAGDVLSLGQAAATSTFTIENLQMPQATADSPSILVVDGRVIVVSGELLESIEETASIVADSEAMAAFSAGVIEIAAGRGIPWEQAKAAMGL
jgi:hypothetical protein